MTKRGRPRRYSEYDALLDGTPPRSSKRPSYIKGIGVFRGARGDTAWVKLHLRHDTLFKGKSYSRGGALEIKLGPLSSWSWAQLEQKREELQGLADRNEALEPPENISFKEWSDDWLTRAEKRLRSYSIVSVHARCHLVPRFGKLRLEDITTREINNWIRDRLRDAAPATVKRELATLSAILGSAVRTGELSSNPCAGADKISGVVGRQRFLDGNELTKLLAAASTVSDWLPDFILWCVHSGMRKGEISALDWTNIRKLANGRTMVEITTSKSDQPRFVTCTQTMEEILERQRKRSKKDNPKVFPVAPITLRRHWEKARAKADLKDVTVHDLRRTHGTHSAAAGVDLRTLAARLGHNNLSMLQHHYAAIVASSADNAADIFQQTFETLTELNGTETVP